MREAVAVRQRHDAAERIAAAREVGDEPERDPDHALLLRALTEAGRDRDALVGRCGAAEVALGRAGRGAAREGLAVEPVHGPRVAGLRVGLERVLRHGDQPGAQPEPPDRGRAGAGVGGTAPAARPLLALGGDERLRVAALGGLPRALVRALAIVEDAGHEQGGGRQQGDGEERRSDRERHATARAAPRRRAAGSRRPARRPAPRGARAADRPSRRR